MVSLAISYVSVCAGLATAPIPRADSVVALYQGGKTWEEFFAGASTRKEMWKGNYDRGAPAALLAARAKAVPGSWRILAVAEDWCGDSANTVPYLVRLTEQAPNLEIRIVNSKIGRWVMERHKTPDGRAATPTIVLLDQDGRERGCFVERPATLRAWVAENKPKLSEDDFQTAKMAWYREDRGAATVAELVDLLEKAGAGAGGCSSPPGA